MRKLPLDINNIIWTLDSYKQLHDPMYFENTEVVVSYGEARSGSEYEYTVWNGLQYQLIRWLEGVVVTKELIDQAEPYLKEHFILSGDVWSRAKWDYIVEKHGGRLPLRIEALPEGMVVPKGNMLFLIQNTDPNCRWLTNALETVIQHVWYPTTVATRSHYILRHIREQFRKTVDDDTQWLADFMLHDFGQRGVTCMEQAGIGGCAHLINSKGTDTDMAIPFAVNFYGAKKEGLCYSVPADEHSIATSGGPDREFEIAQRLCKLFPKFILSKVSDSFGIERAIKEYCYGETRKAIEARDGKFVIRPDSPRWKGDTAAAQILWIAQELEKAYGVTLNKKGFKVINPKVGIIYGDGLTEQDIIESVNLLVANGFSAMTCVFGQGGGLLQKVSRDTTDFAIKCLAQKRGGEWFEVYKKPQGGTKVSKKGLQKVVMAEGAHGNVPITVPISDPRPTILETVFENGVILKEHTLEELRARALAGNPLADALVNNK